MVLWNKYVSRTVFINIYIRINIDISKRFFFQSAMPCVAGPVLLLRHLIEWMRMRVEKCSVDLCSFPICGQNWGHCTVSGLVAINQTITHWIRRQQKYQSINTSIFLSKNQSINLRSFNNPQYVCFKIYNCFLPFLLSTSSCVVLFCTGICVWRHLCHSILSVLRGDSTDARDEERESLDDDTPWDKINVNY